MNALAAMSKRLRWLLFSATLTLIIGGEAHAASLCGTVYSTRGDPERALHSESGRFVTGKGVRTVLVSSPTRLSLGWLTSAGSRAYPAIACVEKVQVTDGAFKQHEAEANCHGAAHAVCEGLRREIAKAKF